MSITPQQMKILHALLNQTGLLEYKAEMVFSETKGRSNSSKDLTIDEARSLINYLKTLNPETSASEKMRRKILSMAHRMRWELPGGAVNMDSVNTFCITRGYLKKPLNDYTYKELPKLVSQFQQVYASVL